MAETLQIKSDTWYRTYGGERVYVIGINPFSTVLPVIVVHGNGRLKYYDTQGRIGGYNEGTDDRHLKEECKPARDFEVTVYVKSLGNGVSVHAAYGNKLPEYQENILCSKKVTLKEEEFEHDTSDRSD